MGDAGVSNRVTNAITGHSEGTMRERYDKVRFEVLMDWIQRTRSVFRKC